MSKARRRPRDPVIDRVRPDGGPVHLVGHDWGAIQSWAAVMREASDARLTGRLASYTSISRPGLEIYGNFFRDGLARQEFAAVGRQAIRRQYVVAFQVPRLPEIAARRFGRHLPRRWREASRPATGTGANVRGLPRKAASTSARANGLRKPSCLDERPGQAVVPTKDTFLNPAVYVDVAACTRRTACRRYRRSTGSCGRSLASSPIPYARSSLRSRRVRTAGRREA